MQTRTGYLLSITMISVLNSLIVPATMVHVDILLHGIKATRPMTKPLSISNRNTGLQSESTGAESGMIYLIDWRDADGLENMTQMLFLIGTRAIT